MQNRKCVSLFWETMEIRWRWNKPLKETLGVIPSDTLFVELQSQQYPLTNE